METFLDKVKSYFLGDVHMATDEETKPELKSKRVKVSQADFPRLPILKTLGIAQTLWNQYAGHPTPPHDIAFAMKLAPTSGGWRNLTGTSIAYGLTEGGYSAKEIELTSLGKRLVSPTEPGDDKRALREAIMKPNIMRSFYEKYNHAKFPDANIAQNVLVSLGLPKVRANTAVNLLKDNGVATGILRETPTGYFVALDEPLTPAKPDKPEVKPCLSEEPVREDYKTPSGKPEKVTFGKGLYVNFEIHIAADTPIETIVAIFENMKKYVIDNE